MHFLVTSAIQLAYLSLVKDTLAISYGTAINDWHDYPFFVIFGDKVICGGSLISTDPAWVLTAAHCLLHADAAEHVYVIIDDGNSDTCNDKHWRQKSKKIGIKQSIIHPYFATNDQVQDPSSSSSIQSKSESALENSVYDLGLVQLALPMKHCIAIGSMMDGTGTNARFVGVGYKDDNQLPDAIQMAFMTYPSHTTNRLWMTATTNSQNTALCHGDSGGPLLISSSSGALLMTGVLSRIFNVHDQDPSRGTCPVPDHGKTAYNAFVNIDQHLDWISNTTGLPKTAFRLQQEEKHNEVKSRCMQSSSGSGSSSNRFSRITKDTATAASLLVLGLLMTTSILVS